MKTKVAVIGCGPVGMFASLLLQHFGINFVTLEKSQTVRAHPSAHWLTARSKCFLSQIPKLVELINQSQQNLNYFTHYRYVQKLGGFQLGHSSHFLPSIQERLNQSIISFGQTPNHIPQNIFLKAMYSVLKSNEKILFNQQIKRIQTNNSQTWLINQKNQRIVKTDYVILCNGVNSQLRNSLNIKTLKNKPIMSIINIHFQSKHLSSLLTKNKINAMLHFIYNAQLPAVLVNHSIQKGIFVLQVPNFEPLVDLMQIYSPLDVVKLMIDKTYVDKVNDIQILNCGKWKVREMLCQMHDRNVILCGDTAHSLPPSGGFGMNCGIQDAHQAVHTLKLIQSIGLNVNSQQTNILLENYSKERVQINKLYLQQSMKNLRVVNDIGNSLGLNQKIMEYMEPLSYPIGLKQYIPQTFFKIGQILRASALKFSYKRNNNFDSNLKLFYDQFQLKNNPISRISNQIFKESADGCKQDFWVKQEKDIVQIQNHMPVKLNIHSAKIKIHKYDKGQKIIRSDGIVLLQ